MKFQNQNFHQFVREDVPFAIKNFLIKIEKDSPVSTLQCLNLKTGTESKLELPLTSKIINRFRTFDDNLVVIDAQSVQIFKVYDEYDSIQAERLHRIPLPEKLVSALTQDLPGARSYNIKMFPGNCYLGILLNNSTFFRIDCTTGQFIKYNLEQETKSERSEGFIPLSESEMIFEPFAGSRQFFSSPRKWFRVKFMDGDKFESSIMKSSQTYDLAAASPTHNFYPLNQFLIYDDNHHNFTIFESIDPPVIKTGSGCIGSLQNPKYYFPELGFVCSLNYSGNKLMILTPEKNNFAYMEINLEESHPYVRTLQWRLAQLDERTIVVHNYQNNDMTAVVLPDRDYAIVSEVYKILYDTVKIFPSPIVRTITDYLKEEPKNLLINSKNSTILKHTLFKPEKIEIKFNVENINSLFDYDEFLNEFLKLIRTDFKYNVLGEKPALEILYDKIKVLKEILEKNSNSDGPAILLTNNNQKTFKGPATFKEDALRFIMLPDLEDRKKITKEFMPSLIQQFQIDKVMEKLQDLLLNRRQQSHNSKRQ